MKPSIARMQWLELRSEFLKMFRMPAYAIPALAFPWLFYLFFGVAFGRGAVGATSIATYLVATYGAFGVIGASLFGFGVGVAVERGQGWLQVKRATPMPLAVWFVAKMGMALLFGTIIVAGLAVLGIAFGGVHLPASTWPLLFAALVFGSLPFCAFGLMIGYLAGPNSAAAVVNVIYLPLSFASGLWVPVQVLPKVLQRIAPLLPPYHLAQLALGTFGAGRGSALGHIAALVAFTALFVALAAVAYRRDEGRVYG
jgi:ABC-2 type transport system permease protein